MPPTTETLNDLLQSCELELSMESLARKAKLSPRGLWNLRNGISVPTMRTITRLAKFLGVPTKRVAAACRRSRMALARE